MGLTGWLEHQISNVAWLLFSPELPPLEGVFAIHSGGFLTVYTIVDGDDDSAYDLIYERERSLIREFSDIRFDFNVIARRGRSLATLFGRCSPIWTRTGAADECLNVTSI
jgi:hypothetical protein